MSDFVLIPYYSLNPTRITLYSTPDTYHFSDKQKETFKNLIDNENKYNEISSNSRKRLQQSIDYLVYCSRIKEISGSKLLNKKIATEIEVEKGIPRKSKINYRITFITLTLSAPQHNTDEEIKSKLLNHFLTILRTQKKVSMYVWKAEKQENGNIHFHILTNQFIHHKFIKDTWNKIQNKKNFEYVNLYSKKMQNHFKDGFKLFENDKRTESKQREVYEKNKKINWQSPNSTDIHAIYKIKNIGAYMSKYLSKGVTKTDRVTEMQELYSNIVSMQEENRNLNLENALRDESNRQYNINTAKIKSNEENIKKSEERLSELKKKGVSGRIWGLSQNLSKLKNFSCLENHSDIPDIKIVDKIANHKSEFKVGNQTIYSYYFDITKTPHLKQTLDSHILSSLT